jgi:hypothetical protein
MEPGGNLPLFVNHGAKFEAKFRDPCMIVKSVYTTHVQSIGYLQPDEWIGCQVVR